MNIITNQSVKNLQDEQNGKVIAVMVGISDYKAINDLNYCDDDIVDIEKALKNSKMYKDAKITKLIDSKATKNGIKNAINQYSGQLNPEDKFLFILSGHGTNNSNKVFLCPHDTYYMGDNLISESELKQWLVSLSKDKQNPAKLGVYIDSCFSGGMIDGKTDDKNAVSKFIKLKNSDEKFNKPAKELSSIKNSVVVTASKADEVSYETSELKNGLFTYFLVEGLGETSEIGPADRNNDGKVSIEESFKYLNPKVVNYENLKDRQHPMMSDKFNDEYIIKQ